MDLNPSALEKQLNERQWKTMAKYMNKSKTYQTYFEFFCWSIIEFNFWKDKGYMFQICFIDRNVIISNISNASMMLKKLWPNLQIY